MSVVVYEVFIERSLVVQLTYPTLFSVDCKCEKIRVKTCWSSAPAVSIAITTRKRGR